MIIEIKIPSFFRHEIPDSDQHLEGDKWEIPEGTTLGGVWKILKFSEQGKVFLLNGRRVENERVLKEGDVVAVYLPIAGG